MDFCKENNITYDKFKALKRASRYYFSRRCKTIICNFLIYQV